MPIPRPIYNRQVPIIQRCLHRLVCLQHNLECTPEPLPAGFMNRTEDISRTAVGRSRRSDPPACTEPCGHDEPCRTIHAKPSNHARQIPASPTPAGTRMQIRFDSWVKVFVRDLIDKCSGTRGDLLSQVSFAPCPALPCANWAHHPPFACVSGLARALMWRITITPTFHGLSGKTPCTGLSEAST